MKEIKLGKYRLEVYDSIDELPIERYHKYNKMLLVDAGVGSTIQAFDAHIGKALAFLKTKPEEAAKELENLRQNVYLLQEEVSPNNLAFCALVATVNGKPQNDLSTEGLSRLVKKFDKVLQKQLNDNLEGIKKKISGELALYFPKLFDDASVKEYFDLIRRRALLQCDGVIERRDVAREVESLTLEIMMFDEPRSFSGTNSEEVKMDRQFEAMCIGLSHHLGVNAKQYTVMEYYSAFEHIKQSNGRKSNKVQ